MKVSFVAIGTVFFMAQSLPLTHAQTQFGFADIVLDYFDSGAGPMAGPYGGTYPDGPGFPIPVTLDVVLGSEPGPTAYDDFLSLPAGSYVTVGFQDEFITDGPGDDLFIQEIGGNGERASVYVSSDGENFFLLGTAQDDTTTSFDLSSIGFTETVSAVKIVGLDNFGASPGFDVMNVQGLIQSTIPKLGGTIYGLESTRIRCINRSTRQSVVLKSDSGNWDCTDAGLDISDGDHVIILMRGSIIDAEVSGQQNATASSISGSP